LRLKAKIILKNISGLNIPKNAVVIVENHPAVYVIENGIAHLKYLPTSALFSIKPPEQGLRQKSGALHFMK
jgi:hypothetical protein